MKRTRIAAVALATAAAALGQPATAADGPYLQDPAGGEKAMKSQWTKDEMHKLEGQLRFHPGIRYRTVTRPGPSGASEYERQVADPKSLGWQPSFDFGWAVSDSQLVKKAVTTKDGRHPIVVHAVLRSADHAKAVEVRQELADRPATGRAKVEGGKRIACDTGAYTVEWSVTRSGYGTLTGTLRWDSSCEQYRTAFSTENGKV
ncbi:hypothetical protein [Streptomyces katrae]|uniref:hypothetical protein n=1 Tax=Streptomyces katrae TaxID=68223 RepID=UPI0004C29291|nr:hypothetical protein [Streptomyces katrae]